MAEEKDFNIVSSEESTKTIDKAPIDPPVKGPKLKAQKYDVFPGAKSSAADRLAPDKNYHVGIDPTKYANEYNKGNVILGAKGVEGLNESRAAQQGWGEQARNMIGQAVVGEIIGGTIEGFGYLGEVGDAIDYLNGTEQEWGNWMTELGKDTREFAQDNMAIHQRNDSGMGDSGWWFSNGVSVASSLSMLIPTGAATKALGMLGKVASKGAGIVSESLNIASKMGKYERWMAEGITQAIVSRHIENSMEASGVFNEQKKSLLGRVNPKTGATFTEEEATTLASHGASSTYRSDWAMLLQDIPQYLALGKVFNPVSMKMESKLAEVVSSTGAKSGLKSALKAGAATFVSEGAEESYQYYVAERGKLLSDLKAGLITEREYDKKTNEKVGDKEMLTSAFWGGLGGNIFQAAGQGSSELFKSGARRTAEANYATIQGDYIAKRGAGFKVMQEEIAKADQTGDPVKREAAIKGSGVQMAIDAIDNGKFAEYIESLQGMSKMSKEEQEGFEKQMGVELDPELFKKYVPSLIEQAQSMRTSYLKHSNKYDSNIAAKMASNDHYVKAFDERSRQVTKEIKEIKDSVPNSSKLTEHFQEKFATKGNLVALKKANEIHQAAIDNTESGYKKENRQALIDKNQKLIDKLALKMSDLTSNDPRTKDEKDSDKLIGIGYEQSAGDLILKATESTLLNDSINLMQKENVKIQSKAYQAELRHSQKINQVNRLRTVDQAEQAKIDVNENKDNSKEKKIELTALIDARIEAIKKEEKNQAAKTTQAEHKAKLEKERIAAGIANPVVVPNANMTPVGKNLEDEFATEETDISSEMTNKSDKAKKVILDSQLNVGAPYPMAGIQGKNYTEWMLNGKDKVGSEVRVAATIGNYPNGTPAHVQQAIDSFAKGIVDANVIDFLPLTAQFGGSKEDKDSDKKTAFLGAKVATKTAEHAALWEKDREVRKAIIEHLVANNNEFMTTVAAQMGGKVNAAPADGGIIPENNIGDFKHLGPVLDEMFDLKGEQASPDQIAQALEPNLMYTNEFGELMTLDGERHKDYVGKQMTLPLLTGSTGARVPMRGTIFLSVPKADGHNFPLKLNIKKHSQSEAEVIADLLTSVIKKENKFDTPLSQMDEKTKMKIMSTMEQELNAMEKEDPSLMDIVDFFTYVSPQTEGKASELFISGEWVKFGNAGLKVTPKALFNHEKLVEFLMNTKRRQFNVALWESSPAYRDYAISSGLINTDAVVTTPLFGGNTNIYIKAPANTKALPLANPASILQHSPAVPGGKPKSERRKMSDKAGVYSDSSTRGKFAATYYDETNSAVEILRDTEALAMQAVTDRYNAETTKGPATTVVIPTKPTPKKQGTQDDMSDLPDQDTSNIKVVIKKDDKSNFNLIIKDGGVVVNESTGKELDPKKDAKLINKALLKSGLLKYEKITVGKQVYAATAIGTIVNITPGSPSNGNEILSTSAIGKKVMSQYTGKFTGKVDGIGSEEVNKLNGEDLVREMIKGKSITDFTVEEQRIIDSVSLDRKKEIQSEIATKRKAALKAIGDAHAIAMRGKSPAREMSDEEIDQIYQAFMGMSGLDAEKVNAFIQAAEVVIVNNLASASMIQRGLKLGYNQAGRYIDMLESMGMVGPFTGDKARTLLVTDKAEANKRIRDSIGFAIEVYNSKNTTEEETTESPKVSDPKMLLMGMNNVDLSNERAITQEQDDLAEVTKVNESTSIFDATLEFDDEIDFSQVDNSETSASQYNADDSTSSMFNLSEDEYGCGF